MEKGFYHPQRGYWQATDVSDAPYTYVIEPAYEREVSPAFEREVSPARDVEDEDGNTIHIPAVIETVPAVTEIVPAVTEIVPAVTRETTQLAELLAGYPEGTIEVPVKPGADYTWQDGEWVALPTAPIEELRDSFPTLNPAQIRLGLLAIDITEEMVEANLAGNAWALVEWRSRPTYRRTHPLVTSLASPDGFNIPDEQVDDLWLWAKDL